MRVPVRVTMVMVMRVFVKSVPLSAILGCRVGHLRRLSEAATEVTVRLAPSMTMGV